MNDTTSQEDPLRPHSYDGIQEYDKSLPNWWLFTFYSTIVFSVGYWIYFHKTDAGPDQFEEFSMAMAALEEQVAAIRSEEGPVEINDAALWAMSRDSAAVEAGKAIYMQNCIACHGPTLEGAIGANLIDNEWLYGSNPMDARKTVVEGILEKGMPPWLPILGEEKVNQVTAFVMSFHQEP